MPGDDLSVNLSLFLNIEYGDHEKDRELALAVPPPPPPPAAPPEKTLEPLLELGSGIKYLLSLFPEQWAEDLKPINWRTCSGDFEAASRVAVEAVEKHSDYGRRVLAALRAPLSDLRSEMSEVLWTLHAAAVRTDFLDPSCRVPFTDSELLVELMKRHVDNPFCPPTLAALALALWCWAPGAPPPAPWTELLEMLQSKDLPNLPDVIVATSSAALLTDHEPELADTFMDLATARYGRLATWLDHEASVFHNMDYSQKTPLDAYLEPLIVDALKRRGVPCWQGLCQRAAEALPNLGDRQLNARLESLLHQRPLKKLPPLVTTEEEDVPGEALAGEDLSGKNLSGKDLARADLSGANLEKADLSGANLEGADLSGANLEGANLTEARLAGANLKKACLKRARLGAADLEEACLEGAELSYANLTAAAMNNANLSNAKLIHASLDWAQMCFVNARYATFVDARLEHACLDHADLYAANLMDARMTECSLSHANLHHATLLDTIMEYADLTKAVLDNTKLGGASLLGAELSGVSLEKAELHSTWVNEKWQYRIRGFEGEPIWL